MDLPSFKLDHWLSKYDFATPPITHNLASSTGPRWTVGELRALGDGVSVEDTILSYAPPEGGRALREAVADFHGADPDWVVTTTGASEALSILFCLFALGWRWLDRQIPFGVVGALGAAIKLQPGLILVWALLTLRIRAVIAGGAVLIVLAALTTVLAGPSAWTDFLALIRAVSDPIRTPHNFTPGAIAFASGTSAETAGLIQLVSTVGVIALLLISIRWATDEASFMIAVIASQLVSPIVWDHYAMILLLPVAYLLASGRWWAVAIPLVTAWPLVGVTPPVAYPILFWVTMIATFLVGHAATDPRQSLGEALAR